MHLKIGRVSPALSALVFMFGAAYALADSKPAPRAYDSATPRDVSPRERARVTPAPALQDAIRALLAQDQAASFTYHLGHVDSFSTRPKATVPAYAVALLRAHGLSTDAQANEQLQIVESAKRRQDLDANLDRRLPVPYEEDTQDAMFDPSAADDIAPENGIDTAPVYEQVKPARPIEAPRALWVGPGEQERAREAAVAKPILLGFLQQHQKVFELDNDDLQTELPGLKQTAYTVGRYARKAVFQQSLAGEPLIGGKTIVLFDRNWNVTAISRMIATPRKLPVAPSATIAASAARNLATEALAHKTQTNAAVWKVATAVCGLDPVRQKRLWVITARVGTGLDLHMRVKLDAATGEVLNISDNVDRHTDAKVRRWGYSGGNLEAPSQYVASDFYIVTNACISAGGLHSTTFGVTTDQDQGEGIPVIRLPEKCRSSNGNCTAPDYTGFGTFKTCEGDGCSSPPSVIHHEINHFLLKSYYDVLSGIDCGGGEQLKFLHEGILGSAVPQAYWHHYYGVGYNPADTFLYKADYDAGRVHVDDASNITLSDYPCDDAGDPYKSGRVAGQVMWEIYHGQEITGSVMTTMPRPATDRDFLVLAYWAAELVDASVFKDRYEMANRVMEIMENYSTLSSTGKQQWCNAWEHHELGTYITSAYCN